MRTLSRHHLVALFVALALPSAASARRTLHPGDHNPAVRVLQRSLHLHADGVFGPGTKRAVKRFQRSHRLHADGIVGAGRPVLGLCFGGQALAAAMGGEVRRAQRAEIGWVQVSGEVGGTWFAWHFDTFVPPPGARELGQTPSALQGFASGPHIGLQFHPEVTPAIVDDWISVGGRDLDSQRLDAAAIRARTAREAQRARDAAYALFDTWAG